MGSSHTLQCAGTHTRQRQERAHGPLLAATPDERFLLMELLLAATLAGVVGSPHCLGMCGGLAVAASGRPTQGLAWSAGRLSSYGALGATAGVIGGSIPGPPWLSSAIAALFLVLFSLRLAGLRGPSFPAIPGLSRIGARLLKRSDLMGRYLFGIVTGLLPCGLVYSALALPLSSGQASSGALLMVGFGLGTVPTLAAASLGLRRLARQSLGVRRLVAGTVLVIGLIGLSQREAPGSGLAPGETESSCH